MLELSHVCYSYSSKEVIKNMSVTINKGEFIGIVGPNGSGKTTLLKLMTGILLCDKGTVEIDGQNIHTYSSKDRAKKMAILPQLTKEAVLYKVKEVIAMGRYVHQAGLFPTWSKKDEEIVTQSMLQTGVHTMQHRDMGQLSGGEQQRVYVAQALAQNTEILLLDEPTNHLDVTYQVEILDILKQWNEQKKGTIIGVFHDLNLASLYCDRILLLENGELKKDDVPINIMQTEIIEEVFRTTIKMIIHPVAGVSQFLHMPKHIQKDGKESEEK